MSPVRLLIGRMPMPVTACSLVTSLIQLLLPASRHSRIFWILRQVALAHLVFCVWRLKKQTIGDFGRAKGRKQILGISSLCYSDSR
ncbi:hypothetical protein L6452_20751 [Arctium lappa]|uniref:Uncharacterized protein n=1 Tax=Arctium lappa TaxID=4217 RepID=A0ACB9BDJ7_ARCLA|nr:hypothetical protein L6452_20751 [Arctium lappa]